MDHDTLRLFLHLSRSLHFGQTSKACHISPSALSRTVQRMERELGHALLERDNRSVRLTPAGARLQEFASDALVRFDELRSSLDEGAQRLRGSLRIFASVTACQSFLPRVLGQFRERYPEVHLQLETGYAKDALEMLGREAVDVAIAALPDRVPAELRTRIVTYTPLIFVAPSSNCEVARMVDRSTIPWGDVPLILPSVGLAREAADRWFRAQRIAPSVYSEVAGNEAILSLVSTGCGVGVVPRLVMEGSPLRSALKALRTERAVGEFRVGVCVPRRKLSTPLISAFWETLEAQPTYFTFW